MNKTFKITFCSMMTALACVLMLLAYFPYFTYAAPAIAALFIMATVIECGNKWAVCSYAASAVLVFLTAEPESRLMYICFFGYYAVVKAAVEKLRKPVIEWILKLLVFNVAVLAVYFIFAGVFGISTEDFGELGKYGAYIFLGLGNAVFVFYDIGLSRIAMAYMAVVHPKVKRLFKNKR